MNFMSKMLSHPGSPSDSSVVSSLSLSDIIDIPDDDTDLNPGTAAATLPTCEPTPCLSLPKLSLQYHRCLPVALPMALTDSPRLRSWTQQSRVLRRRRLGKRQLVRSSYLWKPPARSHLDLRPLSANSQHLAAGLTGVHRYHGLALAAHTRGPIPVPVSARSRFSTQPYPRSPPALHQPQTINPKSPLTIPPPRAVVITHIRLARERACRRTRRALIRWGAVPQRELVGACATERMPSVLGKSVRETPRRMGWR
ncbi:uncharacterized protein B0H18DRAFT_979747, partial [Fomitopsis serialis]|uniref:uncharacterized protein n=1 Tax=Fomitopsis serialis TaxID=139415 RepID=UPI0020082925